MTTNMAAIQNANPFQNYERQTTRAFPGLLTKFIKGDWVAGKDGDILPVGTELVAVMNSLVVGWQCWQDGEPTDARLGLYIKGFKPPKRRELGDTDNSLWEIGLNGEPRDPWAYINALPLVSPDMMKIYTFITGSFGGRTAVDDLCMDHSAAPPAKYPLVALSVSSYLRSKREIGRVKVPVFCALGSVDAAPYDRAIVKALGVRAPSTEMPETLAHRGPERPVSSITYSKLENAGAFAGVDPDDAIPF
jgi:hypothetical protein